MGRCISYVVGMAFSGGATACSAACFEPASFALLLSVRFLPACCSDPNMPDTVFDGDDAPALVCFSAAVMGESD